MTVKKSFSIFIDMDNPLSLILLRGLPGSGKSSLAKVLSENAFYPVFSVDSYFTDHNGKYDFRFDENHLAYKKCAQDTAAAMKSRVAKIFVDNTFTMEWEIEPYFQLAAQYDYRIFVVTVENRHGGRNVHGISGEQISKMAEKYKVILG